MRKKCPRCNSCLSNKRNKIINGMWYMYCWFCKQWYKLTLNGLVEVDMED